MTPKKTNPNSLPPPIDARASHGVADPASGDEAVISTMPGSGPDQTANTSIRKLLWVYFWLLLIEGALRKWILPQFSDALLVVRDPVVLMIYFVALSKGVFPKNAFVWSSLLLAFIALIAAPLSGQYNFVVTFYGLRTSFLHLPLIFLVPAVFTSADIEKIGKWLLLSAVPMSVLVVMQFRAPPSHWLNVSVTGTATQITQGFDKIRPPGTFSFINGLALYLGLVVAFLLAWQLRKTATNSKITIGALFATGIMIATSGSRGVLSSIAIIVFGMFYVCLRRPAFFGKGVRVVLLIIVAFALLQIRHEFRLGMQIFNERITSGGGVRDGLILRQLDGFVQPVKVAMETPVLGHGIGMGTTVASQIIWGKRKLIFSEGEWERIVRESGAIFGFIYLGLRVALVVSLAISAHRALWENNPLPMLIFFAVAPNVLLGQWGVPTSLGFACFGAGLCLAAGNAPHAPGSPTPFRITATSATAPAQKVRGRSIYSEKLHGR